jgi:hypothetical protein
MLIRRSELMYAGAIDETQRIRRWIPSRAMAPLPERQPGVRIEDTTGYAASEQAFLTGKMAWTAPFSSPDGEVMVELYVPVKATGFEAGGQTVVGISLSRLITTVLPDDLRSRYAITLVDQGGNRLVSSSPRHRLDEVLNNEMPLEPPGHGVRIRMTSFDIQARLLDRWLILAVAGLSLASLTSLVLLWRHARRRVAAEVERDRLFTLSIDPMAILDRNGTVLRANPAFASLLGSDVAGRGLVSLAIAQDRETVGKALAPLARDGRIGMTDPQDRIEFEARFGALHDPSWLRWAVRRDPDPSVQTLYAVAHDTTSRKSTETALVAETAFRRAMEDSMLTGMRAFDLNGRVIFVNRAFCEMTGYSEQELLHKDPPFPYWPADDRSTHQANLDAVLAGHAPASGFQVQVQRKDGSRFEARMYVSPLIDGSGTQSGWMTSMTDITEPNRIRRELADAQERFTTVLEELDTAVCVVAPADPERGQVLFANRAYRRVFGDTALERAGELTAEPQELELVGPKGSRWYDLRSRAIRWVDDRIVYLLVATDITERREAERQSREQQAKLQHTSRLVTMGEMASSLAHELNQPLTAISNYSMGLAARVRARAAAGQPVQADELLEMLGKTASQAERAGKVIRRIREFVKRSEPERKTCDVPSLVADAALLAEIDARRTGVALRIEVQPGLPLLYLDPILIEQVLLNLMKNAIEAMRDTPRRLLTVKVSMDHDNVSFAVSDTGTGLASEIAGRLFEPFYTTKSEGMGMGLNICRSVVEAHQGRLWVEANDHTHARQAGCTFRFTLPLAVNQSPEPTEELTT